MKTAIIDDNGLYFGFDDTGSTGIPLPPETVPPHIPQWVGQAWTVIEDHRGETVYSIETGVETVIDALGPIPEDYTTLKPVPFSIWNGTEWVFDRDRWLDEEIRPKRDARINAAMWRYERWDREERLGLTHHDDRAALDTYVQAFCDLPETISFDNPIFPVEPEEVLSGV